MSSTAAPGDRQRVQMLRRIGRRLTILSALMVLLLVVCPFAIWLFEHADSDNITSVGAAYQWLGRTLFETSSAYKLHTGGGYVIYYIVRIAGVSLVAFGTGAIASRLVTTVILKGKGMGSTRAKGHVLICGWSSKGSEIVRELRAKEVRDPRPVVVLARHLEDPTKDDSIEFLRGDPSDADDLRRARLEEASVAIILSDESDPSATAGDKDARTLLTCLAVESICPEVYSCVEVVLADNRQHFARTKVNEMVVSAELTGALLGGAARTPGLSRLVTDLVTHPAGQEFYRMRVPEALVGESLTVALGRIKADYEALVIGFVDPEAQGFDLNPPSTRVLAADDILLVISANSAALQMHAVG